MIIKENINYTQITEYIAFSSSFFFFYFVVKNSLSLKEFLRNFSSFLFLIALISLFYYFILYYIERLKLSRSALDWFSCGPAESIVWTTQLSKELTK